MYFNPRGVTINQPAPLKDQTILMTILALSIMTAMFPFSLVVKIVK